MEFTFGLSSELRSERNDTIALRLLHDIDIKFPLASRVERDRLRRAQTTARQVFKGRCYPVARVRTRVCAYARFYRVILTYETSFS